MAELIPMSLGHLLRRALCEWKELDAIFDLPARKWWKGDAAINPAVSFLGRPAATAVGPAAGPHSQLIQNIVLAWLAGARIFELKTVQILDELEISRPCINVSNVGFNVEWSQELKLEQSLKEYVGAWLMLHILREIDPVGRLEVVTSDPFIFDMSVGYDLKGITSPRVSQWIEHMRNAKTEIDSLRSELTDELSAWRDIEVPSCISNSITLSTFHGCPPDEIQGIGKYVLQQLDMDLVIKLNPTLLGYERVTDLLRGTLGYENIYPIKDAFKEDLQWSEALDLIRHLNSLAERCGRRFSIKLTNTLVVENNSSFFSDERMYLSGQPLHVLSMNLLWNFRQEEVVGDFLPVSFSAGIDRSNFPNAVALGLTPVTTCTDLLRAGGYGRLSGYVSNLEKAMKKLGAVDIPTYIRFAYGHNDLTPQRAAWENTRDYVEQLAEDPRYHANNNSASPRKIGNYLMLFDCINCDKCVPVCPNDANFSYNVVPEKRLYHDLLVHADSRVEELPEDKHFLIEKDHQLACYADFCNECGNCDVFCPEDGGPYVEKPKFFGSRETFERFSTYDGYVLEVDKAGVFRFRGRMRSVECTLTIVQNKRIGIFSDGHVEISVSMDDATLGIPKVVVPPKKTYQVELERLFALRAIYLGVMAPHAVNWASTPLQKPIRIIQNSS